MVGCQGKPKGVMRMSPSQMDHAYEILIHGSYDEMMQLILGYIF